MKAVRSILWAAVAICLFTPNSNGASDGPQFVGFENGSDQGEAASGELVIGNSSRLEMHTGFTGGQIFYTLDGSAASFASTLYTGGIQITQSTTINAVAYNSDFSFSSTNSLALRIAPSFTLSLSGNGSVDIDPPGFNYVSNTVVTLTAHDGNGWTFSRWAGDASGTNPVVQIRMNSDKSVLGIFATHLNTSTTGGGTILVQPDLVEGGSYVKVTAIPDDSHYFAAWGGALSGSDNPALLRITSPTQAVSAAFAPLAPNQASLTVTADGDYTFVKAPNKNVFTKGETALVQLDPFAWAETISGLGVSFYFRGWSGDVSTFDNPAQVTVTNNVTMHANIELARDLTSFFPTALENIPAIGNDGSIYITTAVAIYAFTPELQPKWTNTTGQIEMSMPAVGRSGLIYVGAANGDIVAVNKYGVTQWYFHSGEDQQISPLPEYYHRGDPIAIGGDETIYCKSGQSGQVYAVKNGVLVRTFPAFPIIGGDDTLYVSTNGGFAAISPAGATLWTAPFPKPLAIGSTGDLYGVDGSTLYAVHTNGSTYWTRTIPSGTTSLVVGQTNTLFASTSLGLVAVSSGGNILWTNSNKGFTVGNSEGGCLLTTLHFNNALTFPIESTLDIHSIAPSGSNSWFFERDTYVSKNTGMVYAPNLSASGDVYVDISLDTLTGYLLRVHSEEQPALSTWGMARANAQNTGRAEPLFRTINVSTLGNGTVTRSTRTTSIQLYSPVTLTAVPDNGGHFLYWSGDISSSENPVTVTADTHKNILAVFEPGYQVSATANANGTMSLSTPNGPAGTKVQTSTDLVHWQTVGSLEANAQIPIGTDQQSYFRLVAE